MAVLTPVLYLLVTWSLTWMCCTAQILPTPAEDTDCPAGQFGMNCTEECHCLNGVQQCDFMDGGYGCQDYQCDRGWTGTPYCQTPCDQGHFGANCAFDCHCRSNDTCSRVSGVCSTYICQQEWGGPSCQIRLPKLVSPARIVNATCGVLFLAWNSWNPGNDFGDPPVGSYYVYVSKNSSEYERVYFSLVEESLDEYVIEFHVDIYTTYQFQVTPNRLDNSKYVEGLPSPPSAEVQASCAQTTLAPPTTTALELTTEKKQLSTTDPATTTAPPTTDADTTTVEGETTTAYNMVDITTVPDSPTTDLNNDVQTTTEEPDGTTLPPEPVAVENLTVTVEDSGEVVIQWATPADDAPPVGGFTFTSQSLGVGYCPFSPEPVVTHNLPANSTGLTLELLDWHRYKITLRATNPGGIGPLVQNFFISREIEPTGAVTKLKVVNMTSQSAHVSWGPIECTARGGALKHYLVVVTRLGTDHQLWSATTEDSSLRVPGLTPYTNYTVQVIYVNEAGQGPPSAPLSLRTSSTTPPAPVRVSIDTTSEHSLTVTWEPPVPSHGVLILYQITWATTANGGPETSVVTGPNEPWTHVISDLDPYTDYFVKVRASTKVGYGVYSAAIRHKTAEDVPSAPINLRRVSRNTSCIALQWDKPGTLNGIILKYKVVYNLEHTEGKESVNVNKISTPLVIQENVQGLIPQEATVCRLKPSSRYKFSVSASTSKGFGRPNTMEYYTENAIPEVPPRPVAFGVTNSTLRVTLKEAQLRFGKVSHYYLKVANETDQETRMRRDVRQLEDLNLPGYITAELSAEDIQPQLSFIVGDNRTYGGHDNIPLTPNTTYNLYYVVVSEVDGVTTMSYSALISPVTTIGIISPPEATSAPVLGSSPNYLNLILALTISLGLLLIIIIIIIICCCYCKKKRKSEYLDQNLNATWLSYYKTRYYSTLQRSPKGNWSDINDLDQTRRVTLHDSYSTEDLQVSDIQNQRPTISFEEEYRKLPSGQIHHWTVAEKPQNVDKNRFEKFLAYDHSRVVLNRKKTQGYINANYIHGYIKQCAYIAAQSPFNEITIKDFWYMVYQEKVAQIVFLNQLMEDGIVKSEMYWPEAGARQYGNILVKHIKTHTFANFVVRQFDILQTGGNLQRVTQYQFIAYPDHGVPDDPIPFLEFRMKVKTSVHSGDGPMVVHCGTGVSRAAVFIAVDALLEQARVENAVNVYRFASLMRRNRVMMIRTLKQYIFIYDTLLEALITNYNIVGEDLKVNYRMLSSQNPTTDKSYFREQFEILEEFTPKPTAGKYSMALSHSNEKKNRFPSIVPLDAFRVQLKNFGGALGNPDYINALFVDGYQRKAGFIVTQTPLRSTVADFWQMVHDYSINTIVMLNNSEFKEETCVNYWPSRKGVQKWGNFFVNLVQVVERDHVTVRVLHLTSAHEPSSDPLEVKQFQFESWNMYDKVPWSREGVLQMLDMMELWRVQVGQEDSPVLVHCMDGASQSGLFIACALVCEKMKLEGEVDVFHTVKHIKRRRPHFINSVEQYKFTFKFLWDYMNTRLRRQSSIGSSMIKQPNGFLEPSSTFGMTSM